MHRKATESRALILTLLALGLITGGSLACAKIDKNICDTFQDVGLPRPSSCVGCGDGIIQEAEECDYAAEDSSGCGLDCRWHTSCGDGKLEGQEECEYIEGILNSPVQGCYECKKLPEYCGDGIVSQYLLPDVVINCPADNPNCNGPYIEQCDDGNIDPGDGCDELCRLEPEFYCGNGIVESNYGEECEDGNAVNGDGCNDCKISLCQNGTLDPGEDCDVGTDIPGDDCNAHCKFQLCGNGVINLATREQCDDGNNENGDGCSEYCLVELP